MTHQIDIAAFDAAGHELYRRDFETMKQAREELKELTKSPAFWDRRAEVEGWHQQVYTIQLIKDDEIVADSFPAYYSETY